MSAAIKFYTDTHIAKAVAVQLRARGVDVVRCEEVGLAEVDDLEHLEYATREGRVVISADRDFLRLHARWQAEGKRHSGIMYCLPHLQGQKYIGRIIEEVMMHYELISGGAGNIETDIVNQVQFIS